VVVDVDNDTWRGGDRDLDLATTGTRMARLHGASSCSVWFRGDKDVGDQMPWNVLDGRLDGFRIRSIGFKISREEAFRLIVISRFFEDERVKSRFMICELELKSRRFVDMHAMRRVQRRKVPSRPAGWFRVLSGGNPLEKQSL
jgi:hypothetical protein